MFVEDIVRKKMTASSKAQKIWFIFDPSNFNQVIDGVKKVSGFNNDDQTFEKSSTNWPTDTGSMWIYSLDYLGTK